MDVHNSNGCKLGPLNLSCADRTWRAFINGQTPIAFQTAINSNLSLQNCGLVLFCALSLSWGVSQVVQNLRAIKRASIKHCIKKLSKSTKGKHAMLCICWGSRATQMTNVSQQGRVHSLFVFPQRKKAAVGVRWKKAQDMSSIIQNRRRKLDSEAPNSIKNEETMQRRYKHQLSRTSMFTVPYQSYSVIDIQNTSHALLCSLCFMLL